MKKTIIVLISLILSSLFYGQETSEIEVKFPNSKQIKEQYSVLKSDKEIKTGQYTRYYKSSKQYEKKRFLHSKGIYKNGKKNGEWSYFENPNQGQQGRLLKTEIYDSGNKVGIWETYHYEGEDKVVEKYDYALNKPVRPDVIIRLNYPKKAMDNYVQGDVIVKFEFLKDCSVGNIDIVKSLSMECDNEVIRRFERIGELQKKYAVGECESKSVETTVQFLLP